MSNEKKSVLVFGEVLWDIAPDAKTIGGAPANVAYRLTEQGIDAHLLSRVGKDPRGEEIVQFLENAGVNTEFIQRDSVYPTGYVTVHPAHAGDVGYTIHGDVAYDYIDPRDPKIDEAVRGVGIVYVGTLALRTPDNLKAFKSIAALCEVGELRYFVDINLRNDCYSRDSLDFVLKRADYLKLNHDELEVVVELLSLQGISEDERCFEIMKRYGVDSLFLTKGADGAVAYDSVGNVYQHSGFPVADDLVVDTIGAGDSFSALVIEGILRGRSLDETLDRASRVAATVVMTQGGMSPLEDAPRYILDNRIFPDFGDGELKRGLTP